jgi:hypothetical protein
MKYQTITLAMVMLGVSVPASAQIYESSFTDTNGIEVHAPSTRMLLNPASPVTLTVIAGSGPLCKRQSHQCHRHSTTEHHHDPHRCI